MTTERLLQKLIAVSVLSFSVAALAQSYPTKPVTLVVPFVPGGQIDTSARIVSEPLAKFLGQSVVVENRAGASGNIAYQLVARAPKDGYTILVGYSGTHACNPALYTNLQWDPIKDFAAIGMLTVATHVITVHPSVPANNLKEFIAYVKQNPGKVDFASSGVGTLSHIGAVMFQQVMKADMVHISYKGSGEVMKDFLAGRVQLYLPTPPSVLQHVRAGKLKALAITSMARIPTLADVPTANEAGLPGFVLEAWVALFAPAGTPPDVIAKLSDAVKRATDLPETQQKAAAAGLEVRYVGPDALAAQVRKDLDLCAKTIRTAGIKVE